MPSSSSRDRPAESDDLDAEFYEHESEVRDRYAEERDREAEIRDRDADRRDLDLSDDLRGPHLIDAAADRARASADRRHAAADRASAAAERFASSFDDLTGAYRRTTGMIEARRETARSRRVNQPLTFVFIDVDGLKIVNDNQGHNAGDALLRDVGHHVSQALRSYDLLVRYGGDEFVCLLSNTRMEDARLRFGEVNAALAPRSISVGLAELEDADTVEDVIARADAAMYHDRAQRRHHSD